MKSEKMKPISIVTAFFDIGRGEIGEGYPDYLRRTNDTYFEHFQGLLYWKMKWLYSLRKNTGTGL